jgi:hypothetical protein
MTIAFVRRLGLSSALVSLVALTLGCSSASSGHTSTASTTIGTPCTGPSDCGGDLFCYTGDTPQIDGLCTVDCTASATSDSCKNVDPNTACLVASVCARQCGNGQTCAAGTYCNTNDGICEVEASQAGGGAAEAGGGSGASSATLSASGTNSMGTTTITFTGASTSESIPGVYCTLFGTTEMTLEIFGSTANDQSSAEIKLWNFDLVSGESRQETFTSSSESVDISAMLIGSSTAFNYIPGGVGSGGTGACTTVIDTLTSDSVSGSFECNPLPPDLEGAAGGSLTLTFACPLEPLE